LIINNFQNNLLQIRNYKTHILIANTKTLKNGKLCKESILPKKGTLAQFTTIFETWLNQIPDNENILFPQATPEGRLNWNKPLSRQRIHAILKKKNKNKRHVPPLVSRMPRHHMRPKNL
jgi:hypothetical protein